MSDEQDLTAATEAAWTAFRGRLADHVAAMDDDDVLVVELADAVDDDEPGSAPYVQLCAFGELLVQVEAASNTYLAEAFELTVQEEDDLLDLGWEEPLDEPGWENFHLTLERRQADRVAVLLVSTLRGVFGVVHPAFLDAGGLETDPDLVVVPARADTADPETEVDDDPAFAVMPRSRDHLQELVDEALGEVFPDLKHDADGDIPIRCGRSSAFVRVIADRPAVEIYAEVLIDPADEERLLVELGLLNAAHPVWQFVHIDERVVMRHEVVALPFAPFQLRVMVDRFCDDVDRLAHELQARVGGRLFLDPPVPAGEESDAEDDDTADLVMTGLLELCHLGRPRASTVAGLFEHDRLELIRQIVRIRTNVQSCGEHDTDLVLGALRRALRLVSDGEPAKAVPLPPKPRSVQATLLSDTDLGEESLDLGWSG